MTHLIQQTVLGIQFWSVKCTPATARYAKISSHCNPPHQAFLKWLDYMKTKHFKMFLNVFSASYIYLFKLFSISIVLLLKNNLTNICSKISKIGVNFEWFDLQYEKLWNVYERREKGERTLHR